MATPHDRHNRDSRSCIKEPLCSCLPLCGVSFFSLSSYFLPSTPWGFCFSRVWKDAEMAEIDSQTELTQKQEEELKYLDFLQVGAVHAVALFSGVYNFAKENSGPLRPGVQTVEGTVKTVLGPVYEKFHGVPLDLLKFADHKVDGMIHEVDRHVPAMVKEASTQAVMVAQKASVVSRSIASEVQRAGVVDAAAEVAKTAYAKLEPTARGLYAKYEPVAEHYAVSAWRSLNRLPLFPEVAHIVVPTAAYWSEKYNTAVCYSAERGYALSAYLPLVPTERIAKVFREDDAAEKGRAATGAVSPAGAETTVLVE